MVKKILIILILALCLLCVCPYKEYAYAHTTPHIVIEEEVWLLDIDSSKKLFLLPESYYAKIDNMDNDYYYVTFNSVKGKVEKSIVSTVGYHTQATGTMQEIKIHSQYSDFVSIALKSSMDSSAVDVIVPVDENFIFLGEYPLAEMWYCVRYEDKIGYIKASRTTLPKIEIPTFMPEVKDQDKIQPIDSPESKNKLFKEPKTLRIIIIIGLSIPAIALIILLFKPQRPKKHRYYYEE